MSSKPPTYRLILTVAGIVLAAVALSGRLDSLGRDYAAEALTRALVTFAVARTLDGAISAAQGTEIAFEPGGVGMALTVGQVLDPINDLVERFSAITLVAASSVGLQNYLLKFSGWWGMNALLIAAIAISLTALWWPKLSGSRFELVARNFLLVTIFLRFAMPVMLIASDWAFNTFLSEEQAQATEVLDETRIDIQMLTDSDTEEVDAPEQTLTERLGAMFDSSLRAMNIREQMNRLQARVSTAIEEIVNLIVLFVLETVILPLVFAALFIGALRSLGGRMTGLK